ncbi:SDR family oxidoreductase [Streptomyces prunicolor]|jgi:3-oxoacyl-[acyl-carrier protein] reductase|uniref:SDR family oxidoreductase n=1 Tax=Streptomyces prunicolor TaxID=67348 RepID=UPI0003656EC7|nr:SDR family NAD(P)-dependent oxidoreductase [Streptomyces prunicolor]
MGTPQPSADPTTHPAPERKVALVTGAARGIGAAIAAELHRRGLRVALLDQDDTGARALAKSLDPDGDSAMAVHADVSDPEGTERAVRAVSSAWRSPDVLVNNAARTAPGSVWDVDLDEWDALMATNLRSVLVLTRLCAPAMRERGWGRVINLASLAGQQGGLVAGPHYAAAKAGVLVLTKVFAQELAAHGVTVNAVAPAAVQTPVMDDLPAEALQRAADRIPVGRFGRPEEVAALVGHLAGEDTGYITGATLDVNGGLFMR